MYFILVPLKFLDIALMTPPSTPPPKTLVDVQQELQNLQSGRFIPKYLELIFSPNEERTTSMDSFTAPPVIANPPTMDSTSNNNNNSGYEIPITDLIQRAKPKLSESNFDRMVVGEVKTVL